jgi:hypothetical protein
MENTQSKAGISRFVGVAAIVIFVLVLILGANLLGSGWTFARAASVERAPVLSAQSIEPALISQ